MDRETSLERARRRLIHEVIAIHYGEGSVQRLELLRDVCRHIKLKSPEGPAQKRKVGQGNMPWKKLELAPKKSEMEAISLLGNGRITWTPALHKAMGEPKSVDLLYDAQTLRLGIRPAEGLNGVPCGGQSGRVLMAKTLLEAEGLLDGLALPLLDAPVTRDEEGVWAIRVHMKAPAPL